MIGRKFFAALFAASQIFITSGCTGDAGNGETFSEANPASSSSAPPAQYDNTSAASAETASVDMQEENLFVFRKNGKSGFVNASGEWVIEPKFELAYPFMEGLALVQLDGKSGLIDRNGRQVPLPEDAIEVSTFKGGLAPVTIGGKTGFINRFGKLVTQPILDFPASSIALPSEGMRMIVMDSLFTFIDSTGKIIRQPGFEYALDFFEGRALVSNQGKYGYIDKAGKIAIPMNYDVGWSFSEGLALAGIADGKNFKLSFIDHSGKTAISVSYKMVNPRFTGGLTFFGIEKDGARKYGFINREGKVVIGPVYDKVEEIVSSSSKDLGNVLAFKVKEGDLWGLVSDGIRVKPAFSEISAFHEGLAAASTGTGDKKKFGYIDMKGKWAIRPEYDGANDFSHGLAAVRKGLLIGGVWGYVGKNGKVAIEPQFRFAYDFIGNIAMVQKDNKKALINKAGKVLIGE